MTVARPFDTPRHARAQGVAARTQPRHTLASHTHTSTCTKRGPLHHHTHLLDVRVERFSWRHLLQQLYQPGPPPAAAERHHTTTSKTHPTAAASSPTTPHVRHQSSASSLDTAHPTASSAALPVANIQTSAERPSASNRGRLRRRPYIWTTRPATPAALPSVQPRGPLHPPSSSVDLPRRAPLSQAPTNTWRRCPLPPQTLRGGCTSVARGNHSIHPHNQSTSPQQRSHRKRHAGRRGGGGGRKQPGRNNLLGAGQQLPALWRHKTAGHAALGTTRCRHGPLPQS